MKQEFKRCHFWQEKQALQNMVLACPYFKSDTITSSLLISTNTSTPPTAQKYTKFYFTTKPIQTNIITFHSLEQSQKYIEKCSVTPTYLKNITPYIKQWLYNPNKIYITNFQNKEWRDFLNDVAKLVVMDGFQIEEVMKNWKGQQKKLFQFFDATISLESYYYRWRVYAYLQGEGDKKYSTQPFKFIQEGQLWYPPIAQSLPRSILTNLQRNYLHDLLTKIKGGRKKCHIQECMAFCIYYISCCVDICLNIIVAIVEVIEVEGDFVGLFYLVSDILGNSPNQNYRRLFSYVLPYLIHQISTTPSNHKNQLQKLLTLWQDRFIFDQPYVKGLLYVHSSSQNSKTQQIHKSLQDILALENQSELQLEFQNSCQTNGIPYYEFNKQQSSKLLNDYLWKSVEQKIIKPQFNEKYDGEEISEKDMKKIRKKQFQIVCCEGFDLGMLGVGNQKGSIDLE